MSEQNYSNHRRLTFSYHGALFALTLALDVLAAIILVRYFMNGSEGVLAFALAITAVVLSINFVLLRGYAALVQDRAIRAEENLRHFALSGKLLPAALTRQQIVGLRFAGDSEFVALAERAVRENLTNDDIKKAIKQWRADHDRI